MVDRIVPSYYAHGENAAVYTLEGNHFLGLPSDAIGLAATNNGRPLEHKDEPNNAFFYHIESRTNTELKMKHNIGSGLSLSSYLGAIVSHDKKTILWVNNTNPLP